MKNIQQTLADNIRIYRKWRGFSQEKLGELSGLHRTYIGGIEQQNTNVSVANIGKIAHALQINPALLFIEPSEKLVDAAKRRGKSAQAAIENTGFKPGGYALCSWVDDEIILEPIQVVDQNLAIDILVSLIDQGITENLAEKFLEVQQRVLEFANVSVKQETKLDTPSQQARIAKSQEDEKKPHQ